MSFSPAFVSSAERFNPVDALSSLSHEARVYVDEKSVGLEKSARKACDKWLDDAKAAIELALQSKERVNIPVAFAGALLKLESQVLTTQMRDLFALLDEKPTIGKLEAAHRFVNTLSFLYRNQLLFDITLESSNVGKYLKGREADVAVMQAFHIGATLPLLESKEPLINLSDSLLKNEVPLLRTSMMGALTMYAVENPVGFEKVWFALRQIETQRLNGFKTVLSRENSKYTSRLQNEKVDFFYKNYIKIVEHRSSRLRSPECGSRAEALVLMALNACLPSTGIYKVFHANPEADAQGFADLFVCNVSTAEPSIVFAVDVKSTTLPNEMCRVCVSSVDEYGKVVTLGVPLAESPISRSGMDFVRETVVPLISVRLSNTISGLPIPTDVHKREYLLANIGNAIILQTLETPISHIWGKVKENN